ncbi:MAG: hypothetical protein ACFFFH_05130 [Candidatus Thorarchaeota archaeon]
MIQTDFLRNRQVSSTHPIKCVGIEFDSLLLGMMTAFGLELTEKELLQNIRTLFNQLKLPKARGLVSILRYNLIFLQSNGLITRQKGRYKISQKGEPLGKSALESFRQCISN